MKELSIKEKAYDSNYKVYTELINRLENVKNAIKKQNYGIAMDILCKPYPEFQVTKSTELKESEDEKIRKEIIDIIDSYDVAHLKAAGLPSRIPEYIAWLKKQGEQKTVDEIAKEICKNKELAVAFLKSAGIINEKGELAEQYRQDEQKSTDKVEPKFKVGQTIKKEGFNLEFTIVKIEHGFYYNDVGDNFPFTDQDNWELVEQKLTDKAKPKFKAGDWVVCNNGPHHIFQVIERSWPNAKYRSINGIEILLNVFTLDKQYHLWTIQDAKDGDVLASNYSIFIFSQEYIAGKPEAHCGIMNGLFIVKPKGCWTNEKCYPATKEQQDLLFQKISEEGYEWDYEKKELRKIVQKPTENKQEIKPNGGIVCEDFREGNGYYKVNIAYLSKSQVELIESLVASWQNPTNNASAWSEEDEKNYDISLKIMCASNKSEELINKLYDWFKSLKNRVQPQTTWKPSDEQMEGLECTIKTLRYQLNAGDNRLDSLYNDLKKLKE